MRGTCVPWSNKKVQNLKIKEPSEEKHRYWRSWRKMRLLTKRINKDRVGGWRWRNRSSRAKLDLDGWRGCWNVPVEPAGEWVKIQVWISLAESGLVITDLGVINKDLIVEAGPEKKPGKWQCFQGGWSHKSQKSTMGRRAKEDPGKMGLKKAKDRRASRCCNWQWRWCYREITSDE